MKITKEDYRRYFSDEIADERLLEQQSRLAQQFICNQKEISTATRSSNKVCPDMGDD